MTIKPAPSGNGWECRWRDPDGRQRKKVLPTKVDAETFRTEYLRRRALGPLAVTQLTRKAPTLDQWIAERWTPEHGRALARSTVDRYAQVYSRHIVEQLGSTPITELTVRALRSWQADLQASGVGVGSVLKARAFLSSVLTHAAQSEVITGNPLPLVKAPTQEQRDWVEPLSPALIEAIRAAMLNAAPRRVAAAAAGLRTRRAYDLPAPGTPQSRLRDALIVSLMGYAGLRPGELKALRWSDVTDRQIKVQRALDPDGRVKPTKTGKRRTVKLLAGLAQDLREYQLAAGRPAAGALIVTTDQGDPWTKNHWTCWQKDRWAPACRQAAIDPIPRPYDLRHSFASLLLAEHKEHYYVARQLGHSMQVLTDTYAHLFDEYDGDRIDAEQEIEKARRPQRLSTARPLTTAG